MGSLGRHARARRQMSLIAGLRRWAFNAGRRLERFDCDTSVSYRHCSGYRRSARRMHDTWSPDSMLGRAGRSCPETRRRHARSTRPLGHGMPGGADMEVISSASRHWSYHVVCRCGTCRHRALVEFTSSTRRAATTTHETSPACDACRESRHRDYASKMPPISCSAPSISVSSSPSVHFRSA